MAPKKPKKQDQERAKGVGSGQDGSLEEQIKTILRRLRARDEGVVHKTLVEIEQTPLLKGRLEIAQAVMKRLASDSRLIREQAAKCFVGLLEKGATAITWLVLEACKNSGGVMERIVRYTSLGILNQQDTDEEESIEQDRAVLKNRIQNLPILAARVQFLRAELERITAEHIAEASARKLTTNLETFLKDKTKEQERAMGSELKEKEALIAEVEDGSLQANLDARVKRHEFIKAKTGETVASVRKALVEGLVDEDAQVCKAALNAVRMAAPKGDLLWTQAVLSAVQRRDIELEEEARVYLLKALSSVATPGHEEALTEAIRHPGKPQAPSRRLETTRL